MNPIANRPGLTALSTRVGDYGTFLESMLERISSMTVPDVEGFPLADLTTRDTSDPAIALLDAAACLFDVHTFYQERVMNEAYLRTAQEMSSVTELARLVGYHPRPGVAASVFLAYTIDSDRTANPPADIETTVPADSRVQSMPGGPGETPQVFQTSDGLEASTAWNLLQPRLTRPQTWEMIQRDDSLYLQGTATGLEPNSPLLIDTGLEEDRFRAVRVVTVTPDPAQNRTCVTLRSWLGPDEAMRAILQTVKRCDAISDASAVGKSALKTLGDFLDVGTKLLDRPLEFVKATKEALDKVDPQSIPIGTAPPSWLGRVFDDLTQEFAALQSSLPVSDKIEEKQERNLLGNLETRPSSPPRGPSSVVPKAGARFPSAGVFPRLLASFRPELGTVLGAAIAGAAVTPPAPLRVYAFRAHASLFGANTQRLMHVEKHGVKTTTVDDGEPVVRITDDVRDEIPSVLHLEGAYDKILPDSLLLVETTDTLLTSAGAQAFRARSIRAGGTRALYGWNGKETEIVLRPSTDNSPFEPAWFRVIPNEDKHDFFGMIRTTLVHAQSEELPLAEAPIPDPVCQGEIELDGYYEGLGAGRWVILEGERANLLDAQGNAIPGIPGTEVSLLGSVDHRANPALPNEKNHTFITLAQSLAFCYRRDSLKIYGNVVKATHGDRREETLGSGAAASRVLVFTLRQAPLTYLPAPTAAGAVSTLSVRVDGVEWPEVDSLADVDPAARCVVTKTDATGRTAVIFAAGRPPTGSTIVARYRQWLGEIGNAGRGRISQLIDRPTGAKEVVNPMAASGGVDPEPRDAIRANAPRPVLALDRLVSVQDYADFARTFAGIGKAVARRLAAGGRTVVHLTIAGVNDVAILPESDLQENLRRALRDLGDPALPILIHSRELLALTISASVRIEPGYQWEAVAPVIRAALVDAFSFARRDLGQAICPSEVIAVMQRVPGVSYVDLNSLGSISESIAATALFASTVRAAPAAAAVDPRLRCVRPEFARWDPAARQVRPAQLALLAGALPETLQLVEILP